MKNRHGITWGKGKDHGMSEKWIAICEEHSQIATDTNGKRIRTLSAMDFCECHMGTCAELSWDGEPCDKCGALSPFANKGGE
jgi:hypothetical protein